MKTSLLLLPLLFFAAACNGGDGSEPADTDSAAISVPAPDSAPSAAVAPPPVDTLSPDEFAEMVVKDYASAIVLPRREVDSILKANAKLGPKRLEKAMEPVLERQGKVARRIIAAKYGITVDSLDVLIKERSQKEDEAE